MYFPVKRGLRPYFAVLLIWSVSIAVGVSWISSGQAEDTNTLTPTDTPPLSTDSDVVQIAAVDYDEDGDVDGKDFLVFATCIGGAGMPPNCPQNTAILSDLDFDGDVDGADFLVFSSCYNGSLKPHRLPCPWRVKIVGAVSESDGTLMTDFDLDIQPGLPAGN